MADNTFLRPRIRPTNIDKQMIESLRPKSREQGLKEKQQRKEEENRQTKEFGDLEYRAELEPQLSWNPIARLGYDPDKHKIVNTQGVADLYGTAMFINRLGGGERSVRNLMRAGLSRKDAERVKEDDVITSPNLSFSPVISHEFTHRGFKLLKEERDKDPEAFDKKYGKDAGRILEYTKHRYPGGVGESTEEYYVEMFDDLDTRFNTTSLKVDQDFEKFPKSTVRGTVQSSFAGPTKELKDYSPEADAKRFEQIRGFQDKVLVLRGMDKGILGLMDAAQDILTEQGEPPKFKKESLNFFQKIGKAIGFDEGGLAEQTDTLFGYTAEGAEQEGKRLATDFEKPEIEKYVHPLETVPFFDRPMGASIKDLQVATVDGDPVFETRLGDRYTVRLNPDQRNLRQKFQDDILPAIEEYFKDPTLPTKEQVVGAGKAVAESIIDTASIPGDLVTGKRNLGDLTYADVADTAGMMAIGSAPFKVPEDSLRLFGGINIKGATERKNLNKAVKLLDKSDWTHESGPVPYNLNKKIWEKTGWYVDPTDGQWRIHIDDFDSSLKSFEDAFKIESGQVTFKELGESPLPKDQSKKVKLIEILNHENLYDRYPDLKALDVNFYSDVKKKNTLGSADGKKIYINLAAFEKYGDMKSTILHEIQHIIQEKEGFVTGSNQLNIPNELVENKVQEIKKKKTPLNVKKAVAENKLEKLVAKKNEAVDKKLLPQLEEDIKNTKSEIGKTMKEIYKLDSEAYDLEYQFYRGAGGEIESRLVQKMDDGSVAEGEFPVDVRSSMLKEEGKGSQYRGSQGVDPFQYGVQKRRNPEKLRPFYLDFLKRKYNKTPKETESVARYSDKVKPEVYDAFVELADIQRGAPEAAMTKAQFDLGGGVLGYALEHTGDLTHRMAEYGGRFGDEYVKPKIDRIFNLLTNDYGFEKEVKENLINNIKYQFETGKPNIPLEEYEKQYRKKVSKSLQKYADEHKKVPVYNEMQLAGREAAIAMGEGRYDDALENIYTIKKAIDEGNYSERSLEFDPKIDFRKPKEFAEGGVAMKDQMEMAFMQEGGLKDDGMDRDPVSGNEIPPGSMASEVRDDIPAQLSEGEYVVPADVVQYFGVKFFEDLRMEAKRGLADMESNGRIGGEPMDMPPSDMNQGGMMQGNEPTMPVDTGVGYNVGGMTSNLYNDPTKMDQQVRNVMADNPQNMDMQNRTQAMMTAEQMDRINPPPPSPRGFNPGGLTASEIAARNYITSPTTLNPVFATPGATYMTPPSPSTMVPPTGGVDSSIPSEENCAKMGMDYDPVAKICIPKAVAQTPQQTGGGSDDGDPFANMPKPDPDAWMEKYDYSGTDEGLNNLFDQTKAAIAGGSDLPGLIGTFDKGVTMAHSAANIILLQAQGREGEAGQLLEQWNKARTGALKLTPKEMIDGDRFAIQAAGEHGILLDRDMISPIDNKPLFRNDRDYEKYRVKYDAAVKEKQKQVAEETTPEKPGDDTYLGGTRIGTGDSGTPIYKPGPTTPRPKPRPKPTTKIDIKKEQESSVNVGGPGFRSSTPKKSPTKKSPSKKPTREEQMFVQGINKGGLMTKKKK